MYGFVNRHAMGGTGVSFWLEVKRTTWPTISQAARLAHIAGLGETCYLLRLVSKKEAELYRVKSKARDIMSTEGPPYKSMYRKYKFGGWREVANFMVSELAYYARRK